MGGKTHRSWLSIATISLLSALLAVLPAPANAYPRPGTTERVSVTSEGAQASRSSSIPAISADGRYVAFWSSALNLVPDKTNSFTDVFVHDRATGTIERVSVATGGAEGNGHSSVPVISADGRHVAFSSTASNLVPGDTNGGGDVFVHDRATGATERVSVSSDGAQANSNSYDPAISADGRYVAFHSGASNLVPGDTNGAGDVFVHDRATGATERVSVASDGAEANNNHNSFESGLSVDGRYVAFTSEASNLVPGDTNGRYDVFVHDRATGATERVSVASDGTEAAGVRGSFDHAISADGRYVAFHSWAPNLVPGDTNGTGDVFVHDRATGATERVSVASDGAEANNSSDYPAISADGRHVAFSSYASNLVPGDTNGWYDVFVHDRATGTTELVAVASDGAQANADSWFPAITADGRHVAFASFASNLVPGDTNRAFDVFVHDRGPAVGVGDLSAVSHDARITVSGWATFSGAVLASVDDPPGDGGLGGELTGASLTYRPELEDLLVRLRLASLPTGPPYPERPNDPLFGDALGQDGGANGGDDQVGNSALLTIDPTQWAPRKILAPEAWQEERATGHGIKVAVLDTGVDLDHEDLQCSDKIDVVADSDVVANDSDPDDEHGHGTHVAGIIGACTNNGTGIAGVAPDAAIVPIRVLDADGSGTDAQLIAGINRAAAAGAHVINMSLGYPPGKQIINDVSGIDAAIEAAADSGVVLVAAAGNEASPLCAYPALAEDIVCVGATDPRDAKAWYSNFPVKPTGPALVAPGGTGHQVFCDVHSEEILSTYPAEHDGCDEGAAGYRDLNGTSIASPHVAGVAALIYDRVGGERSPANGQTVIDAIVDNTDDLGTPGYDPVSGHGRVNALKAVTSLPPPPPLTYTLRFTVGTITYEARASEAAVALHRCTPECTPMDTLSGSIGTTGDEVRIAAPRSAIGATAGVPITGIRAFIHDGTQQLDEVTLPDAQVPGASVHLGIAPAGTSGEEVAFDTEADLSNGSFSGAVDVSSLPAGEYDVWARACLAERCGATRQTEIGDQTPPEPSVRRGVYPTTPNDPYFGVTPTGPSDFRPTQWAPRKIQAPQAWQESRATGFGIRVAVLDTGVDLQHEDLQCPGKLDVGSGSDVVNSDSDPDDQNGHGTHVAGIIGACTNNGTGVAGVAPDATIVPVRVLNAAGSGTDAQLIAGLDKATELGVHVVNMSLGYPPGKEIINNVSAIDAAIARAQDAGIVVAAAAGNDSFPLCEYPALAEDVICVGATDPRDVKSAYSVFPNKTDAEDTIGPGLVAPGGSGAPFCDTYSENVLSTIPLEFDTNGCTDVQGYANNFGTSMAAPHVAGAAALVYDRLGGERSPENAQKVIDALTSTAVDLGPPGYDPVYGSGRIDALAAVCAVGPDCDEVEPTPTPTETTTASPSPTESGSPSPSPSESPQPDTSTVSFTDRSAESGQYSDETLFEARLADSNGDPIAGQELTFELTGSESTRSFTAATDQDGVASVTPTLEEMPGPYQLTVRFAGDEDHAGDADAMSFVVEIEDTALALSVHGEDDDKTLRARLSDLDTSSEGIAERTIHFYSDGELIGSHQTDADGVASVALPPGHRGNNRTYETVFEGDDFYLGSSDERAGKSKGGGGNGGGSGGNGAESEGGRTYAGKMLLM